MLDKSLEDRTCEAEMCQTKKDIWNHSERCPAGRPHRAECLSAAYVIPLIGGTLTLTPAYWISIFLPVPCVHHFCRLHARHSLLEIAALSSVSSVPSTS
jgi:hypothetical protein